MTELSPGPLTELSDDEKLFRDSVAQFADEAIRPHVAQMDEDGHFRPVRLCQFHGHVPPSPMTPTRRPGATFQ